MKSEQSLKKDINFKCNESNDFSKSKEKQSILFLKGPDYLKGGGFTGDHDLSINDNLNLEGDQQNSIVTRKDSVFHSEREEIDRFICEASQIISKSNDDNNSLQDKKLININLSEKQNEIDIRIKNFSITDNEGRKNGIQKGNFLNLNSNDHSPQSIFNKRENQGDINKLSFSSLAASVTQKKQIIGFSECVEKEEEILNKWKERQKKEEMAKNIIFNLFQNSSSRQNKIYEFQKRFIEKLTDQSSVSQISKLSLFQKNHINDLASFTIPLLENQRFQSLKNLFPIQINHFLKKSVISPTSTALVIWDLVQSIFTSLFSYSFSILIFFANEQIEGQIILVFEFIALILFLFDMILRFNTSFYHQDHIVTSRNQIARRYLSSYFLADLLSVLILLFKVIFQDSSLIYNPNKSLLLYLRNSIVFLKVASLPEKRKKIEDIIALNGNQQLIVRLISLVTFTIIAAHVAILWYLLAEAEKSYGIEGTWISHIGIQNSSYISKYIYSLYWSVTTMSTIGYGDVVPTNSYEALFAQMSMIFLSSIFAYSINNIGMILQEIEKNSKQLRDEINTFQRFLDRKKVNIELKSRVRHYLRFLADEQKNRNKVFEDSIFNKLSNKLRDEVTININTSIIDKHTIFAKNFSQRTRELMVYAMKEVLIAPNEIIFKDGLLDDQAIYFIQAGKIEIFYNNTNQTQVDRSHLVIKILSDNELFGEISFFSGKNRKASARSLNMSTLYKITREDFIDIVKKTNEDFEKFKMIQDKILIYNDLSPITLNCYSCHQPNHIAVECPKIHQQFDSQKQILSHTFSVNQMRGQISRRKKKFKFNPKCMVKLNKRYFRKLRENCDGSEIQEALLFSNEESEDDDSYQSLNQTTSKFTGENNDELNSETMNKLNTEGSQIHSEKKIMNNSQIQIDKRQNKKIPNNLQGNEVHPIIIQKNSELFEKVQPSNIQQLSQEFKLNTKQEQHEMRISRKEEFLNYYLKQKSNHSFQDSNISMPIKDNYKASFNNLIQKSQDIYQSLPEVKNIESINSLPINDIFLNNGRQSSHSRSLIQQQMLLEILNNTKKQKMKSQPFLEQEQEQDQFDSIKIFKTYFPHNNFDKLMHELKMKKKQLLIKDKKNKKTFINPQGKRRVNILNKELLNQIKEINMSTFGSTIQSSISEKVVNSRLSYGIGMKIGCAFPKSYH